MGDEGNRYLRAALAGRFFGVVCWVALVAGAAVLGAAGASKATVVAFALLGVIGLVVIGLRRPN